MKRSPRLLSIKVLECKQLHKSAVQHCAVTLDMSPMQSRTEGPKSENSPPPRARPWRLSRLCSHRKPSAHTRTHSPQRKRDRPEGLEQRDFEVNGSCHLLEGSSGKAAPLYIFNSHQQSDLTEWMSDLPHWIFQKIIWKVYARDGACGTLWHKASGLRNSAVH